MKSICSKAILSLLFVLFFACDTENEPEIETTDTSKELDALNIEPLLTRKETSTLVAQGINPVTENSIERKEVALFGKSIRGLAIGDYFIPKTDLTEMTEAYFSKSNGETERYASTNRIRLPKFGRRNIRVGVITNGSDAIPKKLRRSVRQAVFNYNSLNMHKLRMTYVQISEAEANRGRDEGGKIDIVIFLDPTGNFVGNGFDGRAFFPSNGNPGRAVGLGNTTKNYSKKNNTLLIMHELGHTLGMAHSDFLTRATCDNTEPLNPRLGDLAGIPEVNGVCNIAGTDPSGNQFILVMRSCGFFIWPLEDFTTKDKDAFRVLYSQVKLPCATKNTPLLPEYCITDQNTIDYIFDTFEDREIARLFQTGVLCDNKHQNTISY